MTGIETGRQKSKGKVRSGNVTKGKGMRDEIETGRQGRMEKGTRGNRITGIETGRKENERKGKERE